MMKARLGASVWRTPMAWVACVGCLAQQDLSSYSEGSAPSMVEPLAADETSGVDSGDAATSLSTPDVDVDEVATSNAEEREPADVPLDTADDAPDTGDDASDTADDASDSTDDPTDPGASVPESTVAGDACTADGEFTSPGSSSCYLLGDSTGSFQSARDFCQAWGGDLVEIGSAQEDALLTGRSDDDAWIGASDQAVEGVFLWPGGDALVYTRWAPGQPDNYLNEDCAELRAVDDIWNDVPCASSKRALCEKPLSEGAGG
jgi:hypothetical protein